MKEIGVLTIYNVNEDVVKKERDLSEIDGYYGEHDSFRPPPKVTEYWLDKINMPGVHITVLLDNFILREYEIDEIITIPNKDELFYHNSFRNKIYFQLYEDKDNISLDEKTIKLLLEYMDCETYRISFEQTYTKFQPFIVCLNGIK